MLDKSIHFACFPKKFWVCLFPTIFTPFFQKIESFLPKGGENDGKQTNSKIFLEDRQSEYFCLTYFSKLNRNQIEKKLRHFEDNPVSRGKPCRKSRKSDTTFRWVLMFFVTNFLYVLCFFYFRGAPIFFSVLL